jgi:hypothetical protein
MPADSFNYALERLDPASRALLDLSLRRGMRTEEIAEVLGAEPESVEASRDEALQRIAGDVGIEELDEVRARLAELPAEEWLGRPNGNGASVADADAEEPVDPVVEIPEERQRRRSLWPLLLGLLLTAAVIVAIALGTSSNDNQTTSSASTRTPSKTPPAANPGGPAKLAPIGATNASGTATVAGKTLKLHVSGLANGHYEVWLYNSILDARSIGQANGGKFTVTATLPRGWKRFRYLDVSRERTDGNVSHSGLSVLRVPTSSLRPAR